MEMMGKKMAMFPADNMNGKKVSGALVQGQMHKPSADGAKLYFNAILTCLVLLERLKLQAGK